MLFRRIAALLASYLALFRFSLERSCYKNNIKYSCVSKKYRFIYFRVPKSANTTVISSLLSNDLEKDKSGTRKDVFDKLTALNFENTKDYTVFTVVRNPYTRVLSAYLQKIVEKGSKRHFIEKEGDVSFEDFISWLENGGLNKNGHWQPQNKIVPLSFSSLVTVKMENLEAELNPLLKKINENMKIKSRQSHGTGSDGLISDYYTPELASRVYALYQEDFKRFGYDRSL